MPYVLATLEVPDQERQYYEGPERRIGGRMAHKITHLKDRATRFVTMEAAQAMLEELGGGYEIVAVDK